VHVPCAMRVVVMADHDRFRSGGVRRRRRLRRRGMRRSDGLRGCGMPGPGDTAARGERCQQREHTSAPGEGDEHGWSLRWQDRPSCLYLSHGCGRRAVRERWPQFPRWAGFDCPSAPGSSLATAPAEPP
jgi:hypothetical protein